MFRKAQYKTSVTHNSSYRCGFLSHCVYTILCIHIVKWRLHIMCSSLWCYFMLCKFSNFHTDKHNCFILHCSIIHNLSNQYSIFRYLDYFQFSVTSNTRINMSASEYLLRISSSKRRSWVSMAMNICKASDINTRIDPSRKIMLIYAFLITMKLLSSISLLLILSLS